MVFDSAGILRGLFLKEDSWIPLIDSKKLGILAEDLCWAVGISKTHFLCVLCKVLFSNVRMEVLVSLFP
jgi:hypothetical protein